MSDPDRDTEPETRRTDPKYDDFPLDRHDAYTEWPIERRTPADHDAMDDVAEEYAEEMDAGDTNLRWIGLAGQTKPYVYDPGGKVVYEGELDEEEERVILREAGRTEVDEGGLGRRIEEFGDEHGGEWLSSVARDHLEDHRANEGRTAAAEPADSPEELSLRDSEFNRRNLLDEEEADVGFFASHTLVNDDGWVHVVERQFDVYADDATGEGIPVEIEEEFLVSEPESAGTRAGDADLIAEDERELTVDVDTGEFGWENVVAEELEEWHRSHVEWPRRE